MWLDRSLLQGPRLALVTSQRQYQRALKAIRATDDAPYCPAHWDACVSTFDVDGEVACIVGVNMAKVGAMTPIDAAAVLVHEAVHVWQRCRESLGPGDLGRELEAYAIQNISAALMRAYVTASSAPGAAGERASA